MLKFILFYLLTINCIGIGLTVIDKYNARHGKRRIRERTLLLTGAFGAAIGMLVTMLLIRHKTLHKRFMIGLPVMILLQVTLAFFLYPYL